jgi:hypothetical protein
MRGGARAVPVAFFFLTFSLAFLPAFLLEINFGYLIKRALVTEWLV